MIDDKVKRGYFDRIFTLGVIPTLECRLSSISATQLRTAMHVTGHTSTRNHRLAPQYAGDINANVGITRLQNTISDSKCVCIQATVCGAMD